MVPIRNSPLWTTMSHCVTSLASGARRGGGGPPRGWRQPCGDAAGASLVAVLRSLALLNRVASGERCGGAGLPRARAGVRNKFKHSLIFKFIKIFHHF